MYACIDTHTEHACCIDTHTGHACTEHMYRYIFDGNTKGYQVLQRC